MKDKIYKLMQQEQFYIPVYVCMFISIACSALFLVGAITRMRETGWICLFISALIGDLALLIMVFASMFDKEFPKVTKPVEK